VSPGTAIFQLVFDLGSHNPLYEEFKMSDLNTTVLEASNLTFRALINEELFKIGEGDRKFSDLHYSSETGLLTLKISFSTAEFD
jgi:hypothetical protein